MFSNKYRVENIIILLLFSLTFYVRTILPFGGTFFARIYYFEILLFCFLMLSMLDFNKFFNFRFKKFDIIHLLFFISFFFFFISSFYYNFQYNSNIQSIAKSLSYFVIIISFFFVFARRIYRDGDFFEKLVDLILLFGFILSVYAFVDYFLLKLHPAEEYRFTDSGIMVHPNSASFLYTVLIPITIYKYFCKRISFSKFLVILLLFSFCFLFTFSRAGYIGVFSAILVMTFFRSKTIFVISLILLVFSLSTFVMDFAVLKSDSSISRGMLAITAINMIFQDAHHFLWGYGVFHAKDVFLNEKIFSGSFEDVNHPHNVIMLLAIQFGALFTISTILTIAYLYIKAFFVRRRLINKNVKLRITLCMAIASGIILQNMFEDIISSPEFFVMPVFFTFLGYIYYAVVYNKSSAY